MFVFLEETDNIYAATLKIGYIYPQFLYHKHLVLPMAVSVWNPLYPRLWNQIAELNFYVPVDRVQIVP